MSTERMDQLKERLQALAPTQLDIIDESHFHAAHPGSRDGPSHFRIVIRSDQFTGLSTLARHRLVYDRVHDLMPYPIHALAIDAKANQ